MLDVQLATDSKPEPENKMLCSQESQPAPPPEGPVVSTRCSPVEGCQSPGVQGPGRNAKNVGPALPVTDEGTAALRGDEVGLRAPSYMGAEAEAEMGPHNRPGHSSVHRKHQLYPKDRPWCPKPFAAPPQADYSTDPHPHTAFFYLEKSSVFGSLRITTYIKERRSIFKEGYTLAGTTPGTEMAPGRAILSWTTPMALLVLAGPHPRHSQQ